MSDRAAFAHLDAWLDAVFSYGESRRIPVVIVRVGANLVAIANLGPDFDVTLPYSQPLVEGRGRTLCGARALRNTASGSARRSSAR